MAKQTNDNEKLIPVYIPRTHPKDDSRYISVNGERILVKTGEQVYLKPKFAEVIENARLQSIRADEYISSVEVPN